MVEKKNIDPKDILVISFTNKAVGELREKINKELRELRKDVRTCNNISADCERIQEHQNYVAKLEQQAQNANKQRFKDKER